MSVCGVGETDLDQMVVGAVQVFVQLDDQTLKKRRELLLLLPRLWIRQKGGELISASDAQQAHVTLAESNVLTVALVIATFLIE